MQIHFHIFIIKNHLQTKVSFRNNIIQIMYVNENRIK